MGELANKYLKVMQARREKIDLIERETAAEVAKIIERLESGRSSGEPASIMPGVTAPQAAPKVKPASIEPLLEIAVTDDCTLGLLKTDLVALPVDAIVNPASHAMAGGGGLEGIIFQAAGREIMDACKRLGGCETGQAKITDGFNLPAAKVIHTAGPTWNGGNAGEADALASCYSSCLNVAIENGLETIAIPAISTGNFGYPLDQATEVAVKTVLSHLSANSGLKRVYFVVRDEDAAATYKAALQAG